MNNYFINSASKPSLFSVELNATSGRKVDSVILPIPQSVIYRGEEMDFSDNTGIGTCADYLSKKYLMQEGAEGTYFIASDPFTLIEGVLNGAVETPLVVCSQCRDLHWVIQMILFSTVMKLHKLGISVVFVKDDIEFRPDEDFASLTKRFAKHIGCYTPELDKGIDALIQKHAKEGIAA
jgi:hypothetical protein